MSLFPADGFVLNSENKNRLLELLRDLSYVEGEVTLASGRKSDFYIDCRQTALHAEGASLIGKLFYSMVTQLTTNAKAVGGMSIGADPLSTATSMTSFYENHPIPAFYVRKEAKGHGLKKYIEGRKNILDGSDVIVLEDVITTGGSSIQAIERIKAEGLNPVALFVLVDRQEGGRENIEVMGVPVASLFTKSDFVKKEE